MVNPTYLNYVTYMTCFAFRFVFPLAMTNAHSLPQPQNTHSCILLHIGEKWQTIKGIHKFRLCIMKE